MENLFFTVLGMSLTGSLVILFVLLARLALRKAPKKFSYVLWAVALLRLLCPVTFESTFSLLPSAQVVPVAGRGESTAQVIRVQTGIPALNSQVNDFFVDHPYQGLPACPEDAEMVPAPPVNQEGPAPDWRTVPAAIWLAGAAGLLGYSLWSLLRLRRGLVGSVPLEGEKNVRLADHIPSPFVLGLVRPVIYLPSDLPEGERDYILLHERTHIRRFDHATRALAWLAVAVHWFNPLVWLAFRLAGRDMEMSCDEAVLKKMGGEIRADYSASLLRLSQGGKLPAGPLAFGGSGVQSRIKNVLSYKKPAFWVTAAALIVVLCLGTALAANRADGFIDPTAVAGFAAARSTSYTIASDNTLISTPADRKKDLYDPEKRQTVDWGDGYNLVLLLNAHSKKVYGHGELVLSGNDHNLVQINCEDGSYYLVDYWYWNGFSFNPFHGGEDDYTTLVTYYDPQGSAGTTWQMEYDFDLVFHTWRGGAKMTPPDAASPAPDGDGIDLTYELGQSDTGPFVRMNGTVLGHTLERNAVWWPTGMEELYDGHPGGLSMRYTFAAGGAELAAWWADEAHTQVAVTTKMSAMLSSYFNSGWWEFTVDLSGEQGRVASMEAMGGESTLPGPVKMYPEAITDQEAVFLARIAAKLLTAAEEFYENSDGPIPSAAPTAAFPYTPEYSVDKLGEYVITGLGDGSALWIVPGRFDELDSLGFYQDPAFFCPRLAGRRVDGRAWWTDEDRKAVGVRFNCTGEGEYSSGTMGFEAAFTVDLETGTVTEQNFGSHFTQPVDGETLELSQEEMAYAAQVFALLMRGAREQFGDVWPAPRPEPNVSLPVTYRRDGADRVVIEGLGAYAEWNAPGSLYLSGDLSFCCQDWAGERMEGHVTWTDETRTALSARIERLVDGPGTGDADEFIVDVENWSVVEIKPQTGTDDRSVVNMTPTRAVTTAEIFAYLLSGAEEFHARPAP